MVETLAPPQQEDEIDMNNTARKYMAPLPEKTTITTDPGMRLMKVKGIGAYIQISSSLQRYEKGKTYTIALAPGERLHQIKNRAKQTVEGESYDSLLYDIKDKFSEAKIINMTPLPGKIAMEVTTETTEYIIQPAGSPDLNRKGAANLLGGVSPIWIYKLIDRGPCHPNGGLTGYIMSPKGAGWIPRQGEARHGSEIFLYKKDVDDFIAAYIPSEDEQQQQREQLLTFHVPPTLKHFFYELAKPELENSGRVTVTRVWAEAKYKTARFTTPELKNIGLEKKLTDRNYKFLQATAAQEGWEAHPRKSKASSANAYRRNTRLLEEIE
jgi:hypothetical protein